MNATLTMALRAAEAAAANLEYIKNELPNRIEEEDQDHEEFLTWAMGKGGETAAKTLTEAYPDHRVSVVIGNGSKSKEIQQGKGRSASAQISWVINLIIGEENFVAGLPEVGVSVTQSINGRAENTAVLFPFLDQSWLASRGRGAQFGDRKVRIENDKNQFKGLTIAAPQFSDYDAQSLTQKLAEDNHRILMSGNSVLDLLRVASAQFDLAYATTLSEDEMDAVSLIAQEAGAITGTLKGRPAGNKGEFLLTSNTLFKHFIRLIRA